MKQIRNSDSTVDKAGSSSNIVHVYVKLYIHIRITFLLNVHVRETKVGIGLWTCMNKTDLQHIRCGIYRRHVVEYEFSLYHVLVVKRACSRDKAHGGT